MAPVFLSGVTLGVALTTITFTLGWVSGRKLARKRLVNKDAPAGE